MKYEIIFEGHFYMIYENGEMLRGYNLKEDAEQFVSRMEGK